MQFCRTDRHAKKGQKICRFHAKLKKGRATTALPFPTCSARIYFRESAAAANAAGISGKGMTGKAIILYSALSMLPCRSIFLPCAFSSLVSLYSETRPLPATAFGRLEEFESFFWRNFLLHVGKPPVFSEMSSLALKIVLHHRRRINQRSSARPPLPKKKGGQTNAPPSPVSPLYWPSRKPGGSKSPWTPNSFG